MGTCICSSTIKMNIAQFAMEDKHKFNIPPKFFGQARPSSERIHTMETGSIGTFYVDFGSIHVDTVILCNRSADLMQWFLM